MLALIRASLICFLVNARMHDTHYNEARHAFFHTPGLIRGTASLYTSEQNAKTTPRFWVQFGALAL